ncbi:MAG: hypothetical protein ACXVI5_07760 [Halobacteriota archaeon]
MTKNTSIYTVEWRYRANKGHKAERFGPYMLQAELIQVHEDPEGQKREKKVQLGAISVEAINEIAQRHTFWVITEAALLPLDLDAEITEQISAELSRVVPLPSEGEVTNFKNRLDESARARRRAQK